MAKTATTTTPAPSTSALEETARALTVTELVTALSTTRTTAATADVQVEEFRNMFEAAKLEASNKRVLLARSAYLLASHPEIATKRFPLNLSASAKAMAGEKATDKERDALRKWLAVHVAAGKALADKKLVFNVVDPTEPERATVEKVHDETLRAASKKKNDKVKAKVAAASKSESEDETDEDGILKSKVETVIPTAQGIIAGLETTLQNIRKFKTDARFSTLQTETVQELLDLIAAELGDDTDTDTE